MNPPYSSFLRLIGASGFYTQSSETTLEDGKITADYDIAVASTLMEAVVKISGEHTLDGYLLALVDNQGSTYNCSATASYSEYSNETVIVINPESSNSIGGEGNSWEINGAMTIDGVEYGVDISSPAAPVPGAPVGFVSVNPQNTEVDSGDITLDGSTYRGNANVSTTYNIYKLRVLVEGDYSSTLTGSIGGTSLTASTSSYDESTNKTVVTATVQGNVQLTPGTLVRFIGTLTNSEGQHSCDLSFQ